MEVHFRPAALRNRLTYRLEDGRLSQFTRQGGRNWDLDLATVDRAVFVDFGASRAPMRRLDLFSDGKLRRVALNAGVGLSTMSGEMVDFLRLGEAICRDLADRRPGSQVTLGEYGAARWMLFGLSILMVLFSIGMVVAMIAGGISGNRVAEVAAPLGILALGGLYMGWITRPGRPRVTLPAAAMADVLKSMHAPDG